MSNIKVPNYTAFNNFQERFFTDKRAFDEYSNFEVKQFGYMLLSNIAKGFPHLSDLILNLKGFNWKGAESPAILKALQSAKFINGFSKSRIPQFIYFKNLKPEKETKLKVTKEGIEFDTDTKTKICNILMMDSKSYQYFKFSKKVQFLGKQLIGEFEQTTKIKPKRKK